jgi:hypothetical protein
MFKKTTETRNSRLELVRLVMKLGELTKEEVQLLVLSEVKNILFWRLTRQVQ